MSRYKFIDGDRVMWWAGVMQSGSDDALPLPLEERRQPLLLGLLLLLSDDACGGGVGFPGSGSRPAAAPHVDLKDNRGDYK